MKIVILNYNTNAVETVTVSDSERAKWEKDNKTDFDPESFLKEKLNYNDNIEYICINSEKVAVTPVYPKTEQGIVII